MGVNMLETINEHKVIQAIKQSLTIGEGYYHGNYKSVTSIQSYLSEHFSYLSVHQRG